MSRVARIFLDDAEAQVEFRRLVNNVIDWGLGRRLEEIRTVLEGIKGNMAGLPRAKKRKVTGGGGEGV